MIFRLRRGLSLVILLICSVASNLFAQAISGDITGFVVDPSGGSVPSAKVSAENEGTGVKTDIVTANDGSYRLSNLPVGFYTLTVTANGFTGTKTTGVRVQLNTVVTQNLSVNVTTQTSVVVVTEAAAVIDTTTAQLQTNFEPRQISELPMAANGTGIWNLSLMGAGVSSQGGVGQGTGPSIAGMRPENNAFTLDGVSNVNHYSTGPLVYTSNEAIAEVSLLQNQFSPEFGGGSGGVFSAVVKSGGNSIHGSIYEYMQNRKLNAVDATLYNKGITSIPRYDNNRLGATIGGPISHNKLFYFGNFEYNPIGQAAVPGNALEAPTAAGYTALNGIAGLSKTNLGVLQKYVPAAATASDSITVAGVNIPIGGLSFSSPNYTNNYDSIVSIDYNMSDKDQFRGRWIYNKSEGLDTSPNFPIFDVTTPNNNYLYSLSEFHNFTPTTQNEFRASFSRNFNQLGVPDIKFPGLDAFPNITIDDLNSINIGPDGPSGSIQNLFQVQDNLSKVVGTHNIKGGYHFTDVILTNYFIQRVRGDYEYNTLEQFLRDLTPDVLGERSAGPTSYPTGFLEHSAFFNDDWRIRPNLTLNLGLRYEYVTTPIASRYQKYSAPASVPGGISFAEPTPSKNEWSPRIGFAYSPGKEGIWSIRGGFSRAFNPTYANLTSNAAPPYFQQTNDVDLNSNAPNFLASGGLSGASVTLPADAIGARSVIGSYTFSGQRPYGVTWSMGVQRVFKKDYTIEARYVGTHGVHLWNQSRLNIVSRVNANNFIPTFMSLPSVATLAALPKTLGQMRSAIAPGGTAGRPFDSLASLGFQGNIVGYAPQAVSSYNGLALQVNKRYSHNFGYIAAYTWSHNIDDATATNFSTYLTPRRSQDFQNLRADKSSSALDRRHRLTFTPFYDWKPFQNGNWFVKNVLGNWNFSGTYTYESPEYATVQSGLDANLNNDSAGDRVIINPAGDAKIGSGVQGYNALGQPVPAGNSGIVAYVARNPTARYISAGSGALANGGRNTFPLRPTNNIDAGLQKRISFHDHYRFDIGAQFYNIFNHAQFTGGLLSDVRSNGFTGARNDLVPSDPLFGRFDYFYSSNSRTLQLVGRFVF